MTTPDKPETTRAFVALTLPVTLVGPVRALVQRLRGQLDDVGLKWVRPEQVHLTLQFLGAMETNPLAALEAALRRTCSGHRVFELHLKEVGCFPTLRNPRVLWLGVAGATETLRKLQQAVAAAVAPYSGREEDREFRPHLTLARVKQFSTSQRSAWTAMVQANQSADLGGWTVRDVVLMKSQLSSAGPTYTALATIPLAAT